jgi:hypothetical protein
MHGHVRTVATALLAHLDVPLKPGSEAPRSLLALGLEKDAYHGCLSTYLLWQFIMYKPTGLSLPCRWDVPSSNTSFLIDIPRGFPRYLHAHFAVVTKLDNALLATFPLHQLIAFIAYVMTWQRLPLILRPSSISYLVLWWIGTNVSEEPAACIFRAEGSVISKMEIPGSHLPNYKDSHPRRLKLTLTAMWNSNVAQTFYPFIHRSIHPFSNRCGQNYLKWSVLTHFRFLR